MMVAGKFHLPFQFEKRTLRFAEQLPDKISPDSSRKELFDIVHVTIDGEDARDFDDAVAIEQNGKGFRLYDPRIGSNVQTDPRCFKIT